MANLTLAGVLHKVGKTRIQSLMKTKRLFLFLFAAGLFLTSCSNDVLVTNQVLTYDYDVRSNQWQLFGDCYRAVLDVPDITRRVVANGNVQVSRCYPGENNGYDIWTPLPCIRTEVTEGADGGDYYYTTFIDYEWTVGTVSIYVTASDLYTGDRPNDMSFRVFISQ